MYHFNIHLHFLSNGILKFVNQLERVLIQIDWKFARSQKETRKKKVQHSNFGGKIPLLHSEKKAQNQEFIDTYLFKPLQQYIR